MNQAATGTTVTTTGTLVGETPVVEEVKKRSGLDRLLSMIKSVKDFVIPSTPSTEEKKAYPFSSTRQHERYKRQGLHSVPVEVNSRNNTILQTVSPRRKARIERDLAEVGKTLVSL